SPARRQRLREFTVEWRARLKELDFDALGQEGRIDYLLLDNQLRYALVEFDRQEKHIAEMAPLLPFAAAISDLQEARRRMEPVDPKAAAGTLAAVSAAVERARRAVEATLPPGAAGRPSAVV